ncbi:hypothetical protein [Botrimarina sp.]|uniref:hypothetical protein n=1 Tax=Botrimarina sp. TaxID=2795802 RepID=UPI0032EE329C
MILPSMASIGTCRICGTGPLRWRRCGVCRREVVLCDECDSAWRTADTAGAPTYATDRDMPCPWCRASLWSNGAEWAAGEERA